MDLHLNIDGPHSDAYTREVADGLSECVRVLNHATMRLSGVDYPSTVYSVLGRMHAAVTGMEQLLRQLEDALVRFRDAGQLGDDSGHPEQALANARAWLTESRQVSEHLARALGRAHAATSGMSFRDGGE